MIIGMEAPEQLEDNLQLRSHPPLDSELREFISHSFSEVPTSVVNPSLWNMAYE